MSERNHHRRREDRVALFRLWNAVPAVYRALAILALVAGIGWSARGLWAEQQELPARVALTEERLDSLAVAFHLHVATNDSVFGAVIRTGRENARQLERVLCLMMAEREEAGWEECLREPGRRAP